MATRISSIPELYEPSPRRGSHRETSAPSPALARQATLSRLRVKGLNWLPWVLVVSLGVTLLVRAEQHYRHWEAQTKPLAVLQAVAARQKLFFESNRAYTSALTDLRLSLPAAEQARIHLVATPRNGRPDYLVEYCADDQCLAMNSRGEVLKPVQLQTALIPVGLPELTLKRPHLRGSAHRAASP